MEWFGIAALLLLLCYSAYPGKVKRLETKVKRLENMNEEGIEEIKSMHAVLELEGVKESLDEDLIFALNTIFCSKFGFNMRNNVAHGMLDDQAFQSFKALYIWWFALKFCYLFCGKLQEENRSKINKKLKQLMEKKDNMDEN